MTTNEIAEEVGRLLIDNIHINGDHCDAETYLHEGRVYIGYSGGIPLSDIVELVMAQE